MTFNWKWNYKEQENLHNDFKNNRNKIFKYYALKKVAEFVDFPALLNVSFVILGDSWAFILDNKMVV